MASWSEFAAAQPPLAAAIRALVHQYGPGLGYLATVRSDGGPRVHPDRKSTRLNSSHTVISYAVFCLKKKRPNHASLRSPLPALLPPYSLVLRRTLVRPHLYLRL